MKKRKLGRTGSEVSPIAIGGSAFTYVHQASGWDPTTAERRSLVYSMLNTALDHWINYIETAPAYGNGLSETLIGDVMRTRRRTACWQAKSGTSWITKV